MDIGADKAAYKILLNAGSVPRDQVERAWKESETSQTPFCDVLVRQGLMNEGEILDLFSRSTGASRVPLKTLEIDKVLIEKIPVKFAWYYKFFPFRVRGGKLSIAVSRILDIGTLDEIRLGLGFEIETAFAPAKEIEEMLKKYYGIGADMIDRILTQTPLAGHDHPAGTSTHEVEDIENDAEAASVPQLVNQIILDAYKKRASDIHWEPFRGKIRLRYRIDGVLHDAPVPPEMKKFFVTMLSRIKIMANLNVAEKRMPQDGKMRVKTQDQTLDLRVSSLPTSHGEGIVIRILPSKNLWALDQLGFETENLAQFRELLQKPNGIVLVTGPTGSGKSTTIYALLSALNNLERKIITLEDPVEYELDGISQIQVAPEIGLTFAQGLRSILRHDPDVMMVGEVRDLETADIAIRAALTGHLILSSLHTNDAASGVTRLIDIGVEPYLVASSVVAFIAQRLVRMICPSCKEEDPKALPAMKPMILADLGLGSGEAVKIYKGRGCESCNGTGFKGRMAILEILWITEEVRKLVLARASSEAIKKKARELGLRTLRQDGWKKVLKGLTTCEEILKVSPSDEPLGVSPVFSMPVPLETPFLPPPEPGIAEKENFTERRKFPRMTARIPVTYRVVDYQGENPAIDQMKEELGKIPFDGMTEDIGAGGMLCISEDWQVEKADSGNEIDFNVGEALEPGNVLDLRIHLTDGSKPIECMGRILRVQKITENQEEKKMRYRIGLLFLVINSTDRARIEKFCIRNPS